MCGEYSTACAAGKYSDATDAVAASLNFGDAAVATNAGKSLVVAASFYAAVVTGQRAVYTKVTGDVPTAFADAAEVFIYKHTTANTISVAVDLATATGFADDEASIAGSLDVTTSAGTIGTGTLTVSESAAINGASCKDCPAGYFTTDAGAGTLVSLK
jgi:hypothetical protein